MTNASNLFSILNGKTFKYKVRGKKDLCLPLSHMHVSNMGGPKVTLSIADVMIDSLFTYLNYACVLLSGFINLGLKIRVQFYH